MTIYDRIQEALEEMKGKQPLYDRASKLNTSVEELIQEQLIAHLGEIDNQMPEYDTHDKTHSEKVLENIEKLLLDKGIGELSFLEALVLRLCCYFHDAGMILPQCYVPLMERLEKDPSEDPGDGVDAWLAANKKGYPDISKQFYCPDSASGFEDFLIEQLELYQKYCMGLPEKPENISETDYFQEKRHDYLRSTHGDRVRVYSRNMATKFLDGLTGSGREDLQKAVGDICASHCWEIGEVKKLTTKLELQTSCPEMTCNVRYLAMLLRLGDVLHFSSDRVNQTVYAERNPMDEVSDRHWTVKLGDLSYTISTDKKDRKIAFDGSFEDPKSYYFLQDHLNWMDEELENYAYFVSDMHGELDSARYALGLPTAVDRERVRAVGFEPDQDLKFKLEHQKIITLLMGMRLYRDEFMCLRELYQNALDACRCMRAENETKGLHGELEIEFGLGTDDGGDYLYCKDQGTGMTMDIVKNYLLRIGNSYYQSAEFRRANAGWGGKVAPVSEFGIGLLSCYMIASRIEVITRHYTKTAEDTIWISMECSDDYGYFKTPGRREKRWIGNHGTVVKLYLMDQFKPMVMDYIPENVRDAIFMWDCCDPIVNTAIKQGTKDMLKQFRNSLYHRVQQFVHIPEPGIPVRIHSTAGDRHLFPVNEPYELVEKIPLLQEEGFSILRIMGYDDKYLVEIGGKRYNPETMGETQIPLQRWLNSFAAYICEVKDTDADVRATALIYLPKDPDMVYDSDIYSGKDLVISPLRNGTYIDGMPVLCEDVLGRPVDPGIRYAFSGKTRPRLTVDRGEIREVPEDVTQMRLALRKQMQRAVIDQVREHFSKHPEALTQPAKKYLFAYLHHKFDAPFAIEVLRELASDIMADSLYYGAPLHEWFFAPLLELPQNCLNEIIYQPLDLLAYSVLMSASSLRIEGKNLQIQNKNDQAIIEQLAFDPDRIPLVYRSIRVDNWPEEFSQYDSVTAYTGLIPERVYALVGNDTSKNGRCAMFSCMFTADCHWHNDPVRLSIPNWQDLLLTLMDNGGSACIHETYQSNLLKEDGNKRYVIYYFVNPRPLREEDEVFLQKYCAQVPKYREGVEKGWSILFYNYHQGYVVAPGIVDRMEMLKLLPQEALEHDDGLEYYFTDGTRAF